LDTNPERNLTEAQYRPEREEKQSVQGYIAIKGTRNGLLLTLEPETPFVELLHALAERLAEAPGFFRGAALALDTSHRTLQVSERTQLEDLLAQYHMSVVSMEQVAAVQLEQVAAIQRESEIKPLSSMSMGINSDNVQVQRDPRESDDTLFLRRTVRSGQAIHHSSNVVVLGDVNPGAEIVAGGDIIVWGVLRGMVHAGYPDNQQALVCSLHMAPVQLRIAHLLSRPPEGSDVQPQPEVAAIKQGQIVVEAWINGRAPRK